MALVRNPNRKNSKVKIPGTAWPVQAVVDTIALMNLHDKTANEACLKLMNDHPDVMARYDVKIADYNKKQGQISGGLHRLFNKLVETDATVFDMAIAAGLQLDNPRPGSTAPSDDCEIVEAVVDPDELGAA